MKNDEKLNFDFIEERLDVETQSENYCNIDDDEVLQEQFGYQTDWLYMMIEDLEAEAYDLKRKIVQLTQFINSYQSYFLEKGKINRVLEALKIARVEYHNYVTSTIKELDFYEGYHLEQIWEPLYNEISKTVKEMDEAFVIIKNYKQFDSFLEGVTDSPFVTVNSKFIQDYEEFIEKNYDEIIINGEIEELFSDKKYEDNCPNIESGISFLANHRVKLNASDIGFIVYYNEIIFDELMVDKIQSRFNLKIRRNIRIKVVEQMIQEKRFSKGYYFDILNKIRPFLSKKGNENADNDLKLYEEKQAQEYKNPNLKVKK